MVNNMTKEEIKKQLFKLKGGEFLNWYSNLSSDDKNNYHEIFQQLQDGFENHVEKTKYENGRNIAMYGI